MTEGLIIGAIISLALASALHSVGGEKLLFKPMFKQRGNQVLESSLARFILRGCWHLLSVMWLALAIILYATAYHPDKLVPVILYVVAGSFLFAGIFDLIMTRGKHFGWPALTAVGLFCAAAVMNLT